MPSANCCMTQPSSPDTLGPRIIRRRAPSMPLFVSSQYGKTGFPCHSSSTTISRLSKQEDIAQLQAIFEAENNPSKDVCGPKSRKSSNSLISVKNRLKKHLSRELKVQKRHSRSSVGTSEEEVERRAELRRIRQKRIQEELSNDFSYDSDAKSLPTIPGVESAGDDSGNIRASEGNAPCLAVTDKSSPSLTSVYMKARAQQLEARFSELSPQQYPISPQSPGSLSDEIESYLSKIANSPGTPHVRQHSLAEAAISSPEEERPNEPAALPPQAPTAPSLKPQRLSSNLSKSSWRLSFTSENRGAHLRSLSQDRTAQTNADEIPRPISQWLNNQGLRSLSQALTLSGESSNREFSASHSSVSSTNYVDNAAEWFDGAHVRDLNTSQHCTAHDQNTYLGQQQHGTEHKQTQGLLETVNTTSTPRYIQELHVKKATGQHGPSFVKLNNIDGSGFRITKDSFAECVTHLIEDAVTESGTTAGHPNPDSRIIDTSGLNWFEDRLEKSESDSYSSKSSDASKNSSSGLPHANLVEDMDGKFNIWRKEFVTAARRAKAKGKSVIGHSIHDLRNHASWSPFPNPDCTDIIGRTRANGCIDNLDLAIASLKDARKVKYADGGSTRGYHDEKGDPKYHKVTTRARFMDWQREIQEKLHQTKDAHADEFLDRTPEDRERFAPSESIELDDMTPTKGIAERTEARKSRLKSEEVALDLQTFMATEISEQKLGLDANSVASGLYNVRLVNGVESTHEKDAKLPNVALDKARFYDDCLVSLDSDEVCGKDDAKKDASATCSRNRPLKTWDTPLKCEKSDHGINTNIPVKRTSSFGHLRKSTDDFHSELKIMESREREKALRIANEAWGVAA